MKQKDFKSKYFGDKNFYRHILLVMMPIMIQMAITNFVGMLDNLMVGRLGTVELSAVSVANLIIFVYNLSVFGAVSGVGIFTAQYYGKKDFEGIRYTFRFKLMVALGLTALAILLMLVQGRPLLHLYLQGKGDVEEAARILDLSYDYIRVILIGLIPHAMTQAFPALCGKRKRDCRP